MATSREDIAASISTAAKRLGYDATPIQRKVISGFMSGSDIFVSLPTGSGKTLCYSALPWTFDTLRRNENPSSIVIVISPLVALMKDQVSSLKKKGLSSIYVGGALNSDEEMAKITAGQYQVVFISPELLLTEETWRDMLQYRVYKDNLVGLIIDEAHCVKKWGDHFRVEYSHIGEIRSLLPENVNVMALTAMATRTSRKSICRILGMHKPIIVSESSNKPNIKYSVKFKTSSLEETFSYLVEEVRSKRMNTDKTIIFCRSYDNVATTYIYFTSELGKDKTDPPGYTDLADFRLVDMFTACTHPQVKDSILKSFTNPTGHLRLIIATVAFGMGLDCSNIRRVINWAPPEDIETYLQETGRAGRDGKPAEAIMYYDNMDLRFNTTESISNYCKLTEGCRRDFLLKDFDGSNECPVSGCECCDLCSVTCKCDKCFVDNLVENSLI